MLNDVFHYIFYSYKFGIFREQCRKGFLDTTNHFILDMYNIAIKYNAQEQMKDIDFNKLDSLIDEFNKIDYAFCMSLLKDKFK